MSCSGACDEGHATSSKLSDCLGDARPGALGDVTQAVIHGHAIASLDPHPSVILAVISAREAANCRNPRLEYFRINFTFLATGVLYNAK